MDVTKENFKENFQQFQSALRHSDFVAVDGEFSGLYSRLKLNPMDEFGERYDVLRRNLKQYVLLQVGICCFSLVSPGEYMCHPFNFNIFPYSADQNKELNTSFLCDSNTLAFLADNNFDFNKVIYSGVPYLPLVSIKNSLRHTDTSPLSSPRRPQRAESSRELDLLDRCVRHQNQGDMKDSSSSKHTSLLGENSTESDELPSPTPCDTLSPISEPDLISDPGLPPSTNHNSKETDNFERMVEMTSFNQVVHLLSLSCKPLILHNGVLDLFHIMNQFYGPLPDNWEDFKCRIHTYFPKIYDTKYLACVDPFREYTDGSSLSSVWDKFSAKFPVKIDFPPDFKRYAGGIEYKHEAGYDAMMTGHIFGSMLSFYDKIDRHANEIFFGLQGIFHFGMRRRDLRPQRDNVIHISTKASQHKLVREEITGLLSPFSGVQNFWFHNNSVFVILRKTLSKSELFRLRTDSVHSRYNIMSYEEYCKAKRKILTNETEPYPKRNKNFKSHTDTSRPKFPTRHPPPFSNGGRQDSETTVFPNVDDWEDP